MNGLSKKSHGLRFSAFLLLVGTALTAVGCDSNEKLFFTIKGGNLEVVFCDKGAGIYSIKYKDTYVTYHPKEIETYLKDDYYYGKCLGRVAGRIKDGKFTLDGKEYSLDINETGGFKNNNIHGGKDSLTTKKFKRNVAETDDNIQVKFTYTSADMESGFPGKLDCEYLYTVYKKTDRIDLNITANTDKNTIVNLSNHPYFRLANDGNILGHVLEMPNVTHLAKFDLVDKKTDQVVVGKTSITDTSVKEYDFTSAPKAIATDIIASRDKDNTSGGYDHIWKYSSNNCKVILKNPLNGLSLTVDSDADAVIMYANCYPHTSDEMNPSGKDSLYAGITVEPIKYFSGNTADGNEYLTNSLLCVPGTPFKRNISYTFGG